jgi:phosphopantothenoylcysteine decarboxylase/phosphopantothenate--cysteine ligase
MCMTGRSRGRERTNLVMTDALEIIPILKDRCLLLGVCGSIAAYKAAELASKLTQAGAQVDVLLTEAATRFVTPLTFQSVTGRRAWTDADLWGPEAHVLHVGLGQAADLLVIAPATATTIARLAHGLADNVLALTALAVRCPVLLAPAMDAGMFEHPATQANLQALLQRGVQVAGPGEGRMASGLVGRGRMLEPVELMGHIRKVLGAAGSLRGRTVLVTAGGTQEPVDPVRVLANRSSGKQGYALAQAAIDHGADVVLISGPSGLSTPVGAQRIDVQTAAEMRSATLEVAGKADALVMAAAVADFRPASASTHKIKRAGSSLALTLEPTDDILRAVAEGRSKGGRPFVVVGFAAESQDLVANASAKMKAKDLSLIVANDITAPGAGFSVDTNRVTLIGPDGSVQALPVMSKAEVAEVVMDRVVQLLSSGA